MSNYSTDCGWSFPPRFYNNGRDIEMVTEEEDIREALILLFSTTLGERFGYPEYGCDLKYHMFDSITQKLINEVTDIIENAVYDYEKRIKILEINVDEADDNSHLLLININYIIVATGSVSNLEFPYLLY